MLIVEDGSGVPLANSYITLEEFVEWADAREVDLTAYNNDVRRAALIISCTDFIDVYYRFKGYQLDHEQGMQLPTDEVGITDRIKQACCQAALYQLQGVLVIAPTLNTQKGDLVRERVKVDVLERESEYRSGSAQTFKVRTPVIDSLLRPYLDSIGMRVVRT